jgi:hypothetical protein
LDRRRLAALLQLDHAALRDLFADDCVYVHSSGRVDTKDQYLARLAKGELRYLKLAYIEPPLAQLVDRSVVLVSGRVAVSAHGRTGGPTSRVLTTLCVYARRNDRWQIVAYQGTPNPAP